MKKLHTRALGSTLALGMVVAGFGAASEVSAETIWNHNVFGGKRALTVGLEVMKEELEKAGGGDFELKLHYASALGPAKQIPENIKIGAVESGMNCAGYYPNKYPLLTVMELPFLAPADTRQSALVQKDIMEHPLIVAELKDRWHSKYFSPNFLPPYEFMGNKRIETTADMNGVKMRISGLNAQALQVFGAVPTMVTAPEGYTALDRGTIDSFGFPYSYAFGAYKLYEVSKYTTEGLAMSGFMCFNSVNLDTWNATPEKVRNALPAAHALATEGMIKAYADADEKWRPIFRDRLEIVTIDPKVRAELAKGAEKIWEQWVADQEAAGRPGREMLDFAKATVAKHSK